jgi:hypothetical protein
MCVETRGGGSTHAVGVASHERAERQLHRPYKAVLSRHEQVVAHGEPVAPIYARVSKSHVTHEPGRQLGSTQRAVGGDAQGVKVASALPGIASDAIAMGMGGAMGTGYAGARTSYSRVSYSATIQ